MLSLRKNNEILANLQVFLLNLHPKYTFLLIMRILYNLFIALLVLILACPATSSNTASAKEKFTVVIDPGHGGGDAGTPHRKQKQDEKTIALNVALKLGKLIEQNYKDVKVVYTRKTDIYPSLPERTQIAKKAKGDLFISIHVNAASDASARGFETYVFGVSGDKSKSADEKKRLQERMEDERENLDINGKMVNFDTDIDIETKILCQAQREKHNKQSLEVANDIHQAIISGLKKTSYAKSINDRGIRPKNLFVLCYSPMPAILLELGYMSNQAEEKFITTDEAQTCFAKSIYNGFRTYKSAWEKRQLNSSDRTISEPEPAEIKPTKPEPTYADPKRKEPETKAGTTKPTKAEPQSAQESKPAQNATASADGITWKVQFLTAQKVLKKGAPELKGLWPVEYYKEGKIYKYTYGAAPSQKALSKDLQTVKAKFKDAFPVKFDKEGKRIK